MTPVVPYARQALVLGLLMLAAVSAAAQAPIGQPVNRFTPADEAQLGAEAADAVLDRLPPLNDADVKHFVAAIGGRLADAIPAELRQPAFRYEVGVLNIRGVTSFALPGGPVFI